MPYKDKDKRKEAAKEAMRKKRQGLTSGVNIPFGTPGVNTVSDDGEWGCTTDGQKYRRDKDSKAILKGWAEGKGTPYQQKLALLGEAYGAE